MLNFEDKINFTNKKNDVLAIGELLVDMISTDYGDNFESNQYSRFFGGSPSNIAINTRRLGIHSMAVAAVGKDGLGDFLINYLTEAQLDPSFIQQVDHATSMVLITKSKATPVPIFYRGADYYLDYSEQLAKLIQDSKILHFSSWPISRSPARHTIDKCIEVAKQNGLLICFDPNYHPKLFSREEDGPAYVKSIIKHVDIIKPSEDDAERLFGEDKHENQVRKFLDLGAKLVIMTLGKDGALVSNGRETIKFSSYASNVVDATGAGDAFWSGFYAALVKGYMLKEALELGQAVSAYKLKAVGGVVDLPKLEAIKAMYKL
ncbi:carbohydrate kinase family protein [Amphibacillus cookii]|uniref:carbohydrate kinase family protein n=1 Tax=Amphibacillus cookii TaxID=767787 RepID=UPI00195BC014|nr:sugar kinase [Amphibacillus cookii]